MPSMGLLAELKLTADGIPEDLVGGAALFQRAADAGAPAAMYALGHLHASGTGVAQSDALAVDYFKKAAAAGHREAEQVGRRRD